MRKKILPALLLLSAPRLFAVDSQWVLDQSTLTYHVSHPLHQSEGTSHAARGKGVCHDGQCDFLIAVPIKSFDSGDSNRDLHMLQVTRGAEYLDAGVAQWLRVNAPKPLKGQNYHLWMREQYGLKKLIEHIWKVIGIASTCLDMKDLRHKMEELYGKRPGFQYTLKLSNSSEPRA